MTGGPGKEHGTNKPPPTRRVLERSKRDTTCLTTSQNPSRWHPSWLSDVCATRKDSKSEWLAKDNVKTNPITIKPETESHVAEQSSWLPLRYYSLPGCPFPVKSLALSACVSPQTIHFQVLDKSPLSGPGRGPPFCNNFRSQNISSAVLSEFLLPVKYLCRSRCLLCGLTLSSSGGIFAPNHHTLVAAAFVKYVSQSGRKVLRDAPVDHMNAKHFAPCFPYITGVRISSTHLWKWWLGSLFHGVPKWPSCSHHSEFNWTFARFCSGASTSRPAEPRLAGQRGTQSPSSSPRGTVRSGIPTLLPGLPDPDTHILPAGDTGPYKVTDSVCVVTPSLSTGDARPQ